MLPDAFQRRVGGEVVSILEDATGGKVEIGHISFDLWHLAIEVDGLPENAEIAWRLLPEKVAVTVEEGRAW